MITCLLAVGCSSQCGSRSGPSTIGELGNGSFDFECVSPTDAACTWTLDAIGEEPFFPGCLAIDGQFRLSYNLLDSEALDDEFGSTGLFIEPGSQTYIERADPFRALREGRAVMLARADAQVVDFIHFTIVEPDEIQMRNADDRPINALEMAVNERRLVRVVAAASRCGALGGALPLQATSNDPSIVTANADGVLELDGKGLGTTTVVVRLGLMQTELTVVIDEIAPDPSTTSTGTGSGTDTGTDTDGSMTPDVPIDATATEGGPDTDTDTDTGADTDTDTDSGTGTGTGTGTTSTGGAT